MERWTRLVVAVWLATTARLALGQQQCYFGPGAEFRGPASLVPCSNDGPSACCLEGDLCLSGNACWNYKTGDTYQYGCTDITFEDATCPYKCGFDPRLSPWTALEFCGGVNGVEDTWVCHAPESCGCDWSPTYDLQDLPIRGCAAMGSEARAALYAPGTIPAYLSLPSTAGGSTGYFSTSVSDGTTIYGTKVVDNYTPDSIGPLTTFQPGPSSTVVLFPGATPAPSNGAARLPAGVPSPVSSPFFPPASSTYVAPPSSSPSSASSASSTSSAASTPHSTSGTTTEPSKTSMSTHRSSTVSTTSSAPSTSSSTSPTAAAASSALTTGAKVGIGVGVAGGVLFVAAIAIVLIFFRRRKRQVPELDANRDSYGSSYGSPGTEKYTSWQSQPSASGSYQYQGQGSPPMGYHYDQSYAYRGVPAVVHEASYSPAEEERIRRAMRPRAELDSREHLPEVDGTPSRSPGTPSPEYGEAGKST